MSQPFDNRDWDLRKIDDLRAQNEQLNAFLILADVDEMQKVFDIVTKTLALREAELSVVRALCARAADALAGWTQNDVVAQPLIDELRKAAAK